MSLVSTIEAAVEKAFTSLGDLVKKGTLEKEEYSSFDFLTGQTTVDTSTKVVDIILTEVTSKEKDGMDSYSAPQSQVLVKTKDIGFSRYTRITIQGIEYRIEEIKQYEGITVLLVRG